MPTPAQKVSILEGSLRCFVLGLFSLIPLIGAGFAIAAMCEYRRVWRERAHEWNPAQVYVCWGQGLACFGALVTLAAIIFIGLLCVEEALPL
jgi:hypothetical protein